MSKVMRRLWDRESSSYLLKQPGSAIHVSTHRAGTGLTDSEEIPF